MNPLKKPMISWWTKFKISRALDERRAPVADKLQTPELRRFAASLRALDERLRQSRPEPVAPEHLHGAVMRAVRAEAKRPPIQLRPPWLAGLAWRPVSACGALAVAGLAWWFVPRGAAPPGDARRPAVTVAATALATAGTTLNAGEKAAARAPAAALAPLEREMAFLQSDFRQAAQLAMASLP